jgi:hypothetical protein
MNRTYYYLRDAITGQYHVDTHNNLGSFDKAVTFLSEKNAIKGRKDRILSSEMKLRWGEPNKSDPSSKHAMEVWQNTKQCSKLPNFGIEVVSVTVKEP